MEMVRRAERAVPGKLMESGGSDFAGHAGIQARMRFAVPRVRRRKMMPNVKV
jgi:hypothetical protein